VPQVQVPKVDGKRCSRSHSRTVVIAYHRIQNACRATGAHAKHYCLDYFTITLFTDILLFFSFSFVHCLAFCQGHKRIWWWQNNSRLYSVVYSPTCYTSLGVGSSAVRNSLNFTPAHWLIKR